MAKQTSWLKIAINSFLLLNLTFLSHGVKSQTIEGSQNAPGAGNNGGSEISASQTSQSTTETSSTAFTATVPTASTNNPGEIAASVAVAAHQVATEVPYTVPQFIHKMMLRYGEVKASEAFQSLDQLPLGLVMKILLVEMDKNLAADIVAMQRYAQSTDKTLITMIGRIVAGDKNVPKEIFAMDVKLMKFPWWMRIRDRMMNNLEKYVAAYSLVPVAAKTAVNVAGKAVRAPVTGSNVDGLRSELAAAVAASATEPSNKAAVQEPAPATPAQQNNINLESLKISLLNPIQQQQLLDTLALAKSATANSNAQTQNLLPQQTQQAAFINPFLFG